MAADPLKVALVSIDAPEIPTWVHEAIAREEIEFVYQDCKTHDELIGLAADADVVWVFGGGHIVTAKSLPLLSRCGVILRSGSGTDNIPVEEATEQGIIVANTPQATSEPVAEHTVCLMLAISRQIPLYDAGIRGGSYSWRDKRRASMIKDHTVGLVGFGHIARKVVRKLSGFSPKLVAYDPYVSPQKMLDAGVQPVSLEDLLQQSDFVSVHCPLKKDTFHLIGERELRMMKPSAFIINTSRGSLINEAALTRALQDNWIAGAGLDVLEQEPPDPNNPLFKLKNVVLTPHNAGYADNVLNDFWHYSVETVIDLAQGKMPKSCVNPGVKPRLELVPA